MKTFPMNVTFFFLYLLPFFLSQSMYSHVKTFFMHRVNEIFFNLSEKRNAWSSWWHKFIVDNWCIFWVTGLVILLWIRWNCCYYCAKQYNIKQKSLFLCIFCHPNVLIKGLSTVIYYRNYPSWYKICSKNLQSVQGLYWKFFKKLKSSITCTYEKFWI